MTTNWSFARAFEAYDEIADDITSTFSFRQDHDLAMLVVENRDRRRAIADLALFSAVYFTNGTITIQLDARFCALRGCYGYDLILSE